MSDALATLRTGNANRAMIFEAAYQLDLDCDYQSGVGYTFTRVDGNEVICPTISDSRWFLLGILFNGALSNV